MPHFRQHVDTVILHRLLRETREGVKVDEQELGRYLAIAENVAKEILRKRWVGGYTQEDLLSFFRLKVLQICQRSLLARHRRPESYFYAAFYNLLNDIERVKQQALRIGYDEDGLDHPANFDLLENVLGRSDEEA